MVAIDTTSLSPPRPNNTTKSLSDYEQEILELRSAMEQLQMKLMEAERKLQNQNSGQNEDADSGRRSSASERQSLAEAETKQIMLRLLREEDHLRREQLECASRQECECNIAMQQQKLAAIDDISDRLSRHGNHNHHYHHTVTAFTPSSVATNVSVTLSGPNVTTIDTGSTSSNISPSKNFASPSRSGSVTVITPSKVASPVSESPKTVDELLDSLHSTPI